MPVARDERQLPRRRHRGGGGCFGLEPRRSRERSTIAQSKKSSSPLSPPQLADVVFGWKLAKELGRLDIGQTVVVKNRAPLALEAIEGTDECIRRAGRLCPTGGMTVVKVAKPRQDLRFDMPTIGVGTLGSLAATGATVLVIEAGRTILVDEPELVAAANRHGITRVACHDAGGLPLVEGCRPVA